MNHKSRHSERSRKGRAIERHPDPWELVWGQPYIDAARLATVIETDLKGAPDPRLPHPAARARRRQGHAFVLGGQEV